MLAVIGCQRLIREYVEQSPNNNQVLIYTKRQVNLWTIFFVCLVVVYAVNLAIQAGLMPVGIIVGSMIVGLIGWRKTTAYHPADPYKVVPLYLLLLCFFFIHVGEETISAIPFNQALALITGTQWPDEKFILLIVLIGTAIFVFAAWSLWLKQSFGNFILWFMIVGMILGEPAHLLVFPMVILLLCTALFGIYHGYAQCYEVPELDSNLKYFVSILITIISLPLLGVSGGMLILEQFRAKLWLRSSATIITIFGIYLLFILIKTQ